MREVIVTGKSLLAGFKFFSDVAPDVMESIAQKGRRELKGIKKSVRIRT